MRKRGFDDSILINGETVSMAALPRFAADIAAGETLPLDTGEKIGDDDGLDAYVSHLDDASPLIASDFREAADIHARYVLQNEIGSGSIGTVVAAVDEHLRRSVALKILQDAPDLSRERIARFFLEAQIHAQLEHPTIAPVHEIGRMPGGMPYFAMKIVRGQSLADILNALRVLPEKERKASRFNLRFMLRRFVQLCNGMAYAHHYGAVHRDLKPANVMIGAYGELQIMDWGMAKVMPGSLLASTICSFGGLTAQDGVIAGTPSYMSPEQAAGAIEKTNHTSDIFAIGLMLAEVITLHRVFRPIDYDTPLELLKKVANAGPIVLSELMPEIKVPAELEAIVRKCTMPRQADRYQDAEEITHDIRAYLEDREVSAKPDGTPQKVFKWTLRNPWFTALAAGLVAGAGLTALALRVFGG
ncbi:MAG: serine/threonine protein kinase [Planctomycetes bacterium]|nr:serine/threonine protein kinase [Planctomycetota bacterium]